MRAQWTLPEGSRRVDLRCPVVDAGPDIHRWPAPLRGQGGAVLGTVDYRVELPEDDTNGSRQVYWSLEDHVFEETRLLVDGHEVASGGGTHTPQCSFEALDEGSTPSLSRPTSPSGWRSTSGPKRVCEQVGNETAGHTEVCHQYADHNESVTVTAAVDVVVRDFKVSDRRASYPNGDTAIALSANRPLLGHSLPHGNVTGTWQPYSACDQDWDALVYSTANGSSRRHLPLHPLQVNAFPFEMGASTSQGTATVLSTDARSYSSPSLPENVTHDVHNGAYPSTETIVTRVPGDGIHRPCARVRPRRRDDRRRRVGWSERRP